MGGFVTTSCATALFLSGAVAVSAQEGDGKHWPVTSAMPEKITIVRQSESIFDALFDPDGDRVLTIYQYTSHSGGKNSAEIQTTGNSLTLKVNKQRIATNITSGNGPKYEVPVSLYYVDGEISEQSPADDSQRKRAKLFFLIQSSRVARDHEPYLGLLTPTAKAIKKAFKAGALRRENFPKLHWMSIAYTGDKICGYDGFRDGGFYITAQPRERERPAPFDSSNVFARFLADGSISRVIVCDPRLDDSCEASGTYRGWANYTLWFSREHFCDMDRLDRRVREWISSKVIAETTRAPEAN